MASPLSTLMKEQAAERSARARGLELKVEQVLGAVDAIENDVRAAVGLQLNSVISNQQQLEGAVRNLRVQVASLQKRCGQWSSQYDGLKQSVSEVGSVETFLTACDAHLTKINEHMDFVTNRLASDE